MSAAAAASDDAEVVEGCSTGLADCTAGTFFKNMLMGRCKHFLLIFFRISIKEDFMGFRLRRLDAFIFQGMH